MNKLFVNVPETGYAAGSYAKPALDDLQMPLPTRLLRAALRRRWVILGAVFAALVAGLLITLLTTPMYRASIRIEIGRDGNRVTGFQGVEREDNTADLEFYQTQYGLLKDRSLTDQVVRTLKLADDPGFFASFDVDQDKALNRAGVPAQSAAGRALLGRLASTVLLDHVAIVPVRASRLVDVNFTSPDAQLSARIVNAWGEEFIQANLRRRFEATSYARSFLETRLTDIRQRLEDSERLLVSYASREGIVNLPGVVDRSTGQTSGERSLLGDEAAHLNDALAVATADRIQAESNLDQTRGSGSNQTALENNAINQLRQKRAELQAEYSRLMVQFEPDYPAAKALQSQIRDLDGSIRDEESRVTQSFRNAYRASRDRETTLRDNVAQLKSGLIDLRRRSIQYNIYQRDVDTNRQLYDGLLQRYKEIGVAGGVGMNNLSIVDHALVPDRPSRPDLTLNLLLSLAAGLALGGGLAWLLERIAEGITDPPQVPKMLNAPLLGVVPQSDDPLPLSELDNVRSPLVESYLAVQTSLQLSTSHGTPRSMLVTSTRPREGKSTTCYALAHSLARAGQKVVLVDADMRASSVHRQFGLPNETGLSNLLSGSDDLGAMLHPSSQPELSILTAGPRPPNAAELLIGPRFDAVIHMLLERFDHVVIDSPPVMGLADAPLIANAVEGVVYVVEAGRIRVNLARIAMERLVGSRARMLGIILTKYDARQSNYGHGYEYGYGYGASADTQ
jgi:succinoglycan biosynthesis transport protein ExoP